MPEQGDWYARGMYVQGSGQYEYNLKHFGHPSEYGYKDICNNWVIDRWKPDELMDLFVEMGARFFMAMGSHHDNFDCYDSRYQPWNSVRIGPKADIVDEISAPAGVLAAALHQGTANCELHLPENKAVEPHLKIGRHEPMEWVDQVM